MVASLEFRGVASNNEREAVRNLLRSEFEVTPGVGEVFARLYDDLLQQDLSVTSECSRVALKDGSVIGHALLVPRLLRICEGDCPAGLVGLVVVHPEYRQAGVGTALIQDVHNVAASRRIGLLVLAGDPGYYRRFGYHHAFTRSECLLRVDSARPDVVPSLRAATSADAALLSSLSLNALPSGSVVPTPRRWQWILDTNHPYTLLAANPRMLGYRAEGDACLIDSDRAFVRMAIGEGRATLYEAGATDPESADRILELVTGFCARKGVRDLYLRLPAAHPFSVSSGGSGGPEADLEFQFKVIDMDALLTCAQPCLEARVARAAPEWTGAICVRTETGPLLVNRRSGSLRVAQSDESAVQGIDGLSMPEWGVGRLLLGKDDILRALPEGEGESELAQILGVLVSDQQPFFTLTDAV